MVENKINRWVEFNSIVDNTELNGKEKIILLILFRYINKDLGYANPSRDRIKMLTKISDNRTLDDGLKALVDKGFLYRERIPGKRTRYYISIGTKNVPIDKLDVDGKNEVGDSVNFVETDGVNLHTKKEEIKENIKYINLKKVVDDVITNINLTQEDYDNLIKKYGKNIVHNKIVMCDDWIVHNKIDIKDQYRTINKWCRSEIDKNYNNFKQDSSMYKEFDFEGEE